jgi:hypothetical protein
VVGNDGGECLVALAAVSFSWVTDLRSKSAAQIQTRCSNPLSIFPGRARLVPLWQKTFFPTETKCFQAMMN